eukprot:10409103-Karenia_brevis.AAC.1
MLLIPKLYEQKLAIATDVYPKVIDNLQQKIHGQKAAREAGQGLSWHHLGPFGCLLEASCCSLAHRKQALSCAKQACNL